MATPEESPPEYDFGLEVTSQPPHYDPDRILEQAIWPAVNYLSRRDWQEKALIGDDLTFPGSAEFEDSLYHATFHAYCSGMKNVDSDHYWLQHEFALEIEENAPAVMQDLILEHARQAEPDLMSALEGCDDLVFKKGVQYAFSTEEEAGINAFQTIESASGAVIWVSDRLDETQVDDMSDEEIDEVVFDTDKFYKDDLKAIARGLTILGVPETCIRALNTIKGQPIRVDGNE